MLINRDMNLPVFKIEIDENKATGMKAMSIVDEGAIESNFITLNKNKEKTVVSLQTENGQYKQIIAGLALIPNKLIYRKNGDYEYYVYFEQDEIERIRNKFHKEKLTDVINLQHNEGDVIDGYLIESYIINSQERLDEVKSQGIEEATLGSWYVQYKIEDEDAFKRALEHEFNGFSIEIMGELVPQELNKLNKKNNSIMSKLNELMNKFKEVLQSFEAMEANIADTERRVLYSEGQEALEVVKNEDGTETNKTLEAGEYILDNGSTITVNEMGIVESVKETNPEPADENNFETVAIADSEQSVMYTEVGNPVYYVNEEGGEGDLVDDGDYTLANGKVLVVADGVLAEVKDAETEEGNDFETQKTELNNQITTLQSEKAELETKVETLQTEKSKLETKVTEMETRISELEKEPVAGPVRVTELKKNKISKKDAKDNLEYNLHKLGLK